MVSLKKSHTQNGERTISNVMISPLVSTRNQLSDGRIDYGVARRATCEGAQIYVKAFARRRYFRCGYVGLLHIVKGAAMGFLRQRRRGLRP